MKYCLLHGLLSPSIVIENLSILLLYLSGLDLHCSVLCVMWELKLIVYQGLYWKPVPNQSVIMIRYLFTVLVQRRADHGDVSILKLELVMGHPSHILVCCGRL